jgi:hypothetical protein
MDPKTTRKAGFKKTVTSENVSSLALGLTKYLVGCNSEAVMLIVREYESCASFNLDPRTG